MLRSLGDVWPVIVTIFTMTFLAGSFNQRVEALDKKVTSIEEIQKDILQIKLKVERIDERLEYLNTKNKDGK